MEIFGQVRQIFGNAWNIRKRHPQPITSLIDNFRCHIRFSDINFYVRMKDCIPGIGLLALHQCHRGHEFVSRSNQFFVGFTFITASVLTAMIIRVLISFSTVQIYDLSYVHLKTILVLKY